MCASFVLYGVYGDFDLGRMQYFPISCICIYYVLYILYNV